MLYLYKLSTCFVLTHRTLCNYSFQRWKTPAVRLKTRWAWLSLNVNIKKWQWKAGTTSYVNSNKTVRKIEEVFSFFQKWKLIFSEISSKSQKGLYMDHLPYRRIVQKPTWSHVMCDFPHGSKDMLKTHMLYTSEMWFLEHLHGIVCEACVNSHVKTFN